MATVTFTNTLDTDAYLHMRIAPLEKNDVLKPGESVPIEVGDGDIWYCYGTQSVGGADDPPLCHAAGGDAVTLDGSQSCFVRV